MLRISSLIMVVRAFFPKGTPNTLKVLFSLMLSYIISLGINGGLTAEINSNYELIMYCANEVMTGLVLGYIINLIFEFVKFAGSIIDTQIGLSMLSMYDPQSESNNTLVANILHWATIVLYFITDSHHKLIASLIESFNLVNVGSSIVNQDNIMQIVNLFAKMFFIGIKISLPIILIIVLTDIAMGLVSRTVPELNVMIIGMPVKLLVGIITFTLAIPIAFKTINMVFSYIPEMLRSVLSAAPMLLIIASDDKTEEATPKKKQDARKKGQIARSKDVNVAMTMVACTLIVAALSGYISGGLKDTMLYFLGNNMAIELNDANIAQTMSFSVMRIAIVLLPVLIPIMISGVVASLAQTGFLISGEGLKPSFSKLNPINGVKNMFSKKSLFALVKNIIVICIITFVTFTYIRDNYQTFLQIGNQYLPAMAEDIQSMILGIFLRVCLILIVIAGLDYFIQYKLHNKELMMSKQEVKEEYKQMEGDPQLKSKIKQKQREIAMGRMMQAVPDATVVVTNPTHIAVALKYEEGKMGAPKLVAKGADNMAVKIKEIAKENEVPIIEDKPLARMIYKEVDIDSEIPAEMYGAVAEILAVLYKMKNK